MVGAIEFAELVTTATAISQASLLRELVTVNRALAAAGVTYRDLAIRRRVLVARCYRAGLTLAEIGDALGLRHRATVAQLRDRAGQQEEE